MPLQELPVAMKKQPKFKRTVRHNKHPVIMNPSYGDHFDEYKVIGSSVLKERAKLIKESRDFADKISTIKRHEFEEKDQTKSLWFIAEVDADEVDEGNAKGRAVLKLQDRLDLAYKGMPKNAPEDRAFAAIIEEFDMPRALPEALLEGLMKLQNKVAKEPRAKNHFKPTEPAPRVQ